MDNLLEIIIPVIIAAIYFFGNIFSKGGDSDDATPSWRPAEQDPDVAAREREIRENLRRKIMERRQQSEGGAPAPTPPVLNRDEPVAHSVEPQSPPPIRKMKPVNAGDFSWDASGNMYETQMQAQLERIAETKRQAERLQKQALASDQKVKQQWGQSKERAPRSSGLLTGSVRSTLKNPGAARTAFVYSEVLGKPISLRTHTEL